MSNTFIQDLADVRDAARPKQRGGVRKGASWARKAEKFVLWADVGMHEHRRVPHDVIAWRRLALGDLADALTIIKNHSRREDTRAEAVRLLNQITKA